MDEKKKDELIGYINDACDQVDEWKLAQYRKNDIWRLVAVAYSWGRIAEQAGATEDDHTELRWRILQNQAIK